MSLVYVIQRRTDQWFWLGANQWITVPAFARTFSFIEDARTAAVQDCPLDCDQWTVEPIEMPDAVEGHAG